VPPTLVMKGEAGQQGMREEGGSETETEGGDGDRQTEGGGEGVCMTLKFRSEINEKNKKKTLSRCS